MTAKQTALIEDFLQVIGEDYRQMFKELSEFVMKNGYNPSRNKTQDLTIDFKNNQTKKTIMKFEQFEQKHDGLQYKERLVPGLRIKFYANKSYSKIFQDAVKRVIEAFDGKYTGCYGCGRCQNKPQGYVYIYPDGKKVFRCGFELLSIFNFSNSDLPEIKLLLQNQMDAWYQETQNTSIA
jgi:hypothetical protein